jgi:hypothetical protein
MTQLQARSGDTTVTIKLDSKAYDFLSSMVEFCIDRMGLKASHSVIVRRALAYYWAGVKQKLYKAKKQ